MKRLLLALLFCALPALASAAPPGTCAINQGFHDLTTTVDKYYICTNTNTWVLVFDSTVPQLKAPPALTHANPANQTGNATTTLKMNGLGAAASACTITPVMSGRVVFTITGQLAQTTTLDGVTVKLAQGTGTAPANAAAVTGTVISATQTWLALTGVLTESFSITATATGLALSTAVWYDLQIAETVGGTASVTNVDCTAFEL